MKDCCLHALVPGHMLLPGVCTQVTMGEMYRDQGGTQPRWVSEEGEAGQEPQRLSLFARNSTNAEPNKASHPVILPFFLFWQCPQLFPTLRPECSAPSSELLLLGLSSCASSPEGPSIPDHSLQVGFLPHLHPLSPSLLPSPSNY